MAILNNSNAISTAGGYDINNSLRFRASASAYLNRTPSSGGNLKTWTASFWYKNGAIDSNQTLFSNATASDSIGFRSSRTIEIYFGAGSANLVTTQVFRDVAAWYHIVVAVDTTQATAANRIKLYINGSQVTAFSTATYPSQNYDTSFNKVSTAQNIGRRASASDLFLDGYMAEVNWIDGQALTPSSFGETDTTTGVWKPKAYTGTYGTNGFYLKFSDIATTSGSNAGLGKDFSGNANYWTTNNISVTAGTTYDAMTDSPTLTSATVANYAVMNPLDAGTGLTISGANLNLATTVATSVRQVRASMALPSTGKYYWEVVFTGGADMFNGIGTSSTSLTSANTGSIYVSQAGNLTVDGSSVTSYGVTYANNDVMGIAVDMDATKIYWYKNGTLINSGGYTFTAGTNTWFPLLGVYNTGNTTSANFGQRPFANTPPTGFVRLNTYNLPTPTILQGNKYMDATLYTGTGTTQVIVNQAQFKPDLIWTKSRSSASLFHNLMDSVRGTNKDLYSNSTAAEDTNAQIYTAINSNGFSVGTDNSANQSGQTFVGWQWQASQGSTSSNTQGSITSTVSVNTTAGFSVITYAGSNSSPNTIGHGLGVAPKLWIIKNRSSASGNWVVNYIYTDNGVKYAFLNTTAGGSAQGSPWSTLPTSSVITLGGNDVNTCQSGSNYVCYAWTEIAGFSKITYYTGNGSSDGPFVYTGFRPKFVMVKRVDASGTNWTILDTARDTYNYSHYELYPNTSGAEVNASSSYTEDILSNGFKIRQTDATWNASGGTYLVMAFAEHPFKNANAR